MARSMVSRVMLAPSALSTAARRRGLSSGQGTALLRGNHQFANQLGEHLAALGVLGRLAMLDVGPFAVAGHGSSIDWRAEYPRAAAHAS
jgi:hypothetical protein